MMGRRLVLINPPFQRRVQRIAQTSVGPPLGLAYLAAAVRAGGHEVEILDANAMGWSVEEVSARAALREPHLVGITATTPTIDTAGAIAASWKARNPGVPVVIGGPHATALPQRTLREHPAVDLVALGEAEGSLVALLDALAAGVMPGDVDVAGFVVRRTDGGFSEPGPAPVETDLDRLPIPARDLLPMDRYRCPDSDAFTTIMAMRGCPYDCSYCAVPVHFGQRIRYRDPARVVAEMREVHETWGTRFFSFVDDTFTTRRSWVEEFASRLMAEGLHRRIRWICLTRVDLVDPELLATLRAAGCVRVELGIESGSEAGRRYLRKGITEEDVLRAFRDARRAGLSTMGFIILNIPGETAADVDATLDLAFRADPDFLQVSMLTPYPGTALWDDARAKGWITTEDWSRYVFLNQQVLDHGSAPPDEVLRRLERFHRRFYLRPRTAWKLARLVLRGTAEPGPMLRTVVLGLRGLVSSRRRA